MQREAHHVYKVRGVNNCELGRRNTFNIKDTIACETANVVYAIVCRKCDATVYVGETERPLKKRLIDHMSTIRTKKDIAVVFITGWSYQ
jgi:hypothetical protein